MKSAVVSGTILVCLIIFIILNSFLCIRIIDGLTQTLSAQTEMSESAISSFEERWNKHETFLRIGVNSLYIDSISESIIELKAAIKTKSEEEITSSLDMLMYRLDRLKRLNKFNIANVF